MGGKKITKELTTKDEVTDFLLYNSPDGKIRVDVFLHNENVWLTQKKMAELFDIEVNTINYHLKEIFKTKELDESSTIRKIRIVQKEGGREVKRDQFFYNLDAIISVGYRVNSKRATQFRIWATKILKEYVIKGFTLDDERLKNGKYFGKDYFKELLERVRSIRASERRIYQQITDIFAECSIDYDRTSDITRDFYATIQNKFHYAISGQTAAEIIYKLVNSKKH
ncbi:virulence RhuM family protein, partial [Candidatus Woesearchaeota archaeon]|nr:virulence RhuM family protein [Candidatus Woesearchaeota archaeon]